VLEGFAVRLTSCIGEVALHALTSENSDDSIASVQDACLLAMLRVTAECDEVPVEVVSAVNELGKKSGRHIRLVSRFSSLRFDVSDMP